MGDIVSIPIDFCPKCGASVFGKFIRLVDFKTGKRGTLSYYECDKCGLHFSMYLRGLTKGVMRKAKACAKGDGTA